jgi:dipeptide/tripeptide permease
MLATGTNVGRLLSSLSFGVLWNSLGRVSSVGVFAVGLTIALVVAVTKLRLSVFSTRAHGG